MVGVELPHAEGHRRAVGVHRVAHVRRRLRREVPKLQPEDVAHEVGLRHRQTTGDRERLARVHGRLDVAQPRRQHHRDGRSVGLPHPARRVVDGVRALGVDLHQADDRVQVREHRARWIARRGEQGVPDHQRILPLHHRHAEPAAGPAQRPGVDVLGEGDGQRAVDAALAVAQVVDRVGVDAQSGVQLRDGAALGEVLLHEADGGDDVDRALPEHADARLGVEVVEGVEADADLRPIGPAIAVDRRRDREGEEVPARGQQAGAQGPAVEVAEAIAAGAGHLDDHRPALGGLHAAVAGRADGEGDALLGLGHGLAHLPDEAAALAGVGDRAALEVPGQVGAVVDVVLGLVVLLVVFDDRQLVVPDGVVGVREREVRQGLQLAGRVLRREDRRRADPLDAVVGAGAQVAGVVGQQVGQGLVDRLEGRVDPRPFEQRGQLLGRGDVGADAVLCVHQVGGVGRVRAQGEAPIGREHRAVGVHEGVGVHAVDPPPAQRRALPVGRRGGRDVDEAQRPEAVAGRADGGFVEGREHDLAVEAHPDGRVEAEAVEVVGAEDDVRVEQRGGARVRVARQVGLAVDRAQIAGEGEGPEAVGEGGVEGERDVGLGALQIGAAVVVVVDPYVAGGDEEDQTGRPEASTMRMRLGMARAMGMLAGP